MALIAAFRALRREISELATMILFLYFALHYMTKFPRAEKRAENVRSS